MLIHSMTCNGNNNVHFYFAFPNIATDDRSPNSELWTREALRRLIAILRLHLISTFATGLVVMTQLALVGSRLVLVKSSFFVISPGSSTGCISARC